MAVYITKNAYFDTRKRIRINDEIWQLASTGSTTTIYR